MQSKSFKRFECELCHIEGLDSNNAKEMDREIVGVTAYSMEQGEQCPREGG